MPATSPEDTTLQASIAQERLGGTSFAKIAAKYNVTVGQAIHACKEYAKQGFIEGEISLANPTGLFPGQMITPFNPSELVTRKGMEVFDKMRRDDQVKAAVQFKKMAVMASDWEVVEEQDKLPKKKAKPPQVPPAGEVPPAPDATAPKPGFPPKPGQDPSQPPAEKPEGQEENDELTRFTDYVLRNIEGSFKVAMTEVLTAIEYGYSISEKVYKEIDRGDHQGLIGLRAIKTRRPHEFDFLVDQYGNLMPKGIQQRTMRGVDIYPSDKFVIFTHQMEFSNYYGRSDLEAAYRAWWIKDNAYKWLAMMLERFGIPPIFALYDPLSMTREQVNQIYTAIKKIQAASAGALPRSRPEALELWHPELGGQTERVFIPALEMFNRDIARALLMPNLLGASPDQREGSYARASVQFDMFMLAVQNLRAQIEEIVNHQIIRPLADLNFPEVKKYPVFRFLPIADDKIADLMTRWTQLVQAEVVHGQDEDEEHIRRVFNFPQLGANARPFLSDKQAQQQKEALDAKMAAGGPFGEDGPMKPGEEKDPADGKPPMRGGGRKGRDKGAVPPGSKFQIDRLSEQGAKDYANFNPNQPRGPKGSPQGGEWVDDNNLPTPEDFVDATTQAATDARMEKQAADWAASLSPEEHAALESYMNSHSDLLRQLRSDSLEDRFGPQVAAMDSALRRSVLSEDTVLYRGLSLDSEAAVASWASKIGKTISDKSFASTTTSPMTAYSFATMAEHTVILRIKAPKGSSAAYVAGLSSRPEIRSEREVLLPRSTKMKIKGVSKARFIEGDAEDGATITVIEAELSAPRAKKGKAARSSLQEEVLARTLAQFPGDGAVFSLDGEPVLSEPSPISGVVASPEASARAFAALRAFADASPDWGAFETVDGHGAFAPLLVFADDGIAMECRTLVKGDDGLYEVVEAGDEDALAAARELTAKEDFASQQKLTAFVVLDTAGNGQLFLEHGWGQAEVSEPARNRVGILKAA